MFQLPTTFANDVASTSTQVIAGLAPYLTLVIGVLLAALVISVLVSAIRHH